MTETSKGGLAIAKHIAPSYVDDSSVKVILVGGSVSRGCADEYSDLEIGVFWAERPSVRIRKAAIKRVGGELWSLNESQGNETWGLNEITVNGKSYAGTLMVSTINLSVTETEARLSDVIDCYDTDIEKQGLLSAIQHGFPLHGATILERWQTRASAYPDELARRMVRENLWMGPWFCPEQYIGRDDLLVLYDHYIQIQQGILKVLSGLNRVYYPTTHTKWMDWLIQQMSIAPPDLSVRLKSIFHAGAASAWNELKALVFETLCFVEHHMPDVGTPVSGEQNPPHVNMAWAKRRWMPHSPYSLMRNIAATVY